MIGVRDGRTLDDGKVFFGYKDSISQPRFKHVDDPDQTKVTSPSIRLELSCWAMPPNSRP